MNTTAKTHYQNAQIARTYDRERFTSVAGRALDALEKRALLSLVSRASREIPNPATLDIPCGTGRITECLLESGLSLTGGDISSEMIEVAREKCRRFGTKVQWRRLDLDGLDLAHNSVDLVTCIRLFHHLDSATRARILGELARVTRRFVIFNVSFSSPFYRWRRRLKRRLGQGVSRTSSTSEEILRETSTAGLRVVATRFVCRYASEDLILLCRKV